MMVFTTCLENLLVYTSTILVIFLINISIKTLHLNHSEENEKYYKKSKYFFSTNVEVNVSFTRRVT